MITDSVQHFCEQYGLSNVSMEEGGTLNLTIENLGNLQLVHKAPHFLVGLNRKIENFYLLNARKILAQAHFREAKMKPLHTQLHDDKLGIYFIFQEREIDTSTLSQALDSLTETLEQIFQHL